MQSCCCFLSLESGSCIIAIVQLVLSLLLIIFGGITVDNAEEYQNLKEELDDIYGIALLVFGLLSLVFNSLLLVGINEKRPKLIYLWLVMNAICLVLSAISSVTSVLTYTAVGDPSENWIIACKFICLAIGSFLWTVVNSFHQQVNKEEKNTTLSSRNAGENNASKSIACIIKNELV